MRLDILVLKRMLLLNTLYQFALKEEQVSSNDYQKFNWHQQKVVEPLTTSLLQMKCKTEIRFFTIKLSKQLARSYNPGQNISDKQ